MTQLRFYAARDPLGELTNFYHCTTALWLRGIEFHRPFWTSEHMYQFMKYWYPGASDASKAYADEIRTTSSPAKAKYLARQSSDTRYTWQQALQPLVQQSKRDGVAPRADWDDVKCDMMLMCLRIKFRGNAHCRSVLLRTGDAVLVEASVRDWYWGEGRDRQGQNMLGKLLMQVRSELRVRGKPATPEHQLPIPSASQ